MRRAPLASFVCAGGILALAGCTSLDPYYRQDVWQPSGANAANIAAMVANPYDLIRGHGSRSLSLSKDQVTAVDRAWSGAVMKSNSGSAPASGGSAIAGAVPGE